MNVRRCLKIAERIGVLLEHEIGVGIEAERMLTDRLYLRDVLLVCEAHRGCELAELATWFRRSAAEASAARPAAAGVPSLSDFLVSGSGSGSASGFDASGHSGAGALRDTSGPMPLPSAEVVRRQLDQQREAARLGGLRLARSATTRSA